MPREEREAAAGAPWLHSAQPESAGPAMEALPGLVFALQQFALNIPEATASLCKLVGAPTLEETRATTVFDAIGQRQGQIAALVRSERIDARLLIDFRPENRRHARRRDLRRRRGQCRRAAAAILHDDRAAPGR